MNVQHGLAAWLVSESALGILAGAGYEVRDVEPTYVRHKPGETTIVAFRLTDDDGSHHWAYVQWCEEAARAAQIHAKAQSRRPRPVLGGPGVALVDNRSVLSMFPNDARLRRLRWYADPRKLKRTLADLPGLEVRIRGSRSTVEVLRYKPERRMVAKVELATADRRRRPVLLRCATARGAHALAATARHLRHHGVLTPRPVAQLEAGRVSIDEFVAGSQLGEVVRQGGIDAESVAAAIGRFHDTPPPGSPARRSAAGDLARARSGLDGIVGWHRSLGPAATQLLERLASTMPDPTEDEVLLHGDLHTKNLLVHEGAITFVDLERVAIGPAAIDLGFLLAHATALDIRRPGWSPDAVDHAAEVVDRCRTRVGDRSLAWHTAIGLAEQAVLVVRHLEPGWEASSVALVEAAHEALDARVLGTAP